MGIRRYDFKYRNYVGQEGRLIPLLQSAQAEDGYLTPSTLRRVAAETGIPVAQVHGVATFYAQFRFTPAGRHAIKVCCGTACHVSDARAIAEAIRDEIGIGDGETTADGEFSVESVSCLGCCSLAPVVMVGDVTHGNLTPKSVRAVCRQYRTKPEGGTP